MDKLKSNRTITIKINGNERKFKDEPEVESQSNRIESEHSTELDGYSEVAAIGQAADESFDWILPEDDKGIEEYIFAKKPIEKKKNSISNLKKSLQKKQHTGPVKSLFFSIFLAIIIGTSFGFLVLKLVISDAKGQDNHQSTIQQETISENRNDAVNTIDSLQLQPINMFIVQGGVFSNVDSAKTEAEKLKQMGISTQIIEANDQAYLFLGIADSIEKAKRISSDLKAKGLDVFAKAYSIPEKNLNDLTSEEANFLKEIEPVYQALTSMASSGLLLESIDEEMLQKQKDFLLSIDKQEIKSTKIDQLRLELAGAIETLAAYDHQEGLSFAAEAQQHLLTFFGIYLSL